MTKVINYVKQTKKKEKNYSFEGTLDDLMLNNTKYDIKWVIF